MSDTILLRSKVVASMLSLQHPRNLTAVFLPGLLCILVGCSKPEPNALTKNGNTKLIDAISGGKTGKAKTLIDEGADVNARNDHGYTALMAAAVTGNTEIANILLSKGADVTPKDKEKVRTALMWAEQANEKHPEVAKMLKEAGAKE